MIALRVDVLDWWLAEGCVGRCVARMEDYEKGCVLRCFEHCGLFRGRVPPLQHDGSHVYAWKKLDGCVGNRGFVLLGCSYFRDAFRGYAYEISRQVRHEDILEKTSGKGFASVFVLERPSLFLPILWRGGVRGT